MHKLALLIGNWRIVASNILVYWSIDMLQIESYLKLFILLCTAIISILTIMLRVHQWRKRDKIDNQPSA